MKITELFRCAEQLLFVPKCVGCGARLGWEDRISDLGIPPFCRECGIQYEAAKLATCPVCNAMLSDCMCSNDYMKRNGLARLIKLFHYEAGVPELPSNRLIYTMKHQNHRVATEFMAHELIPVIARHICDIDGWCLTYAPRSRKMSRFCGFDQSEELAKAIGRQLHIPVIRCLVRDRRAVEQKKLNREQRIANMRNRYSVRKNVSLTGKKILLLDDVVTTGCTMLAAARALRRAGVSAVISVAPAAAYKNVTRAQEERKKQKARRYRARVSRRRFGGR